METLKKLWLVLQGKKTYIAAGLLMAIGVYGLWSDNLSDPVCWTIIVTAFGLVGLGDKADRMAGHTKELIEALRDMKAGKKPEKLVGDTVFDLLSDALDDAPAASPVAPPATVPAPPEVKPTEAGG